MRDIDGPHESDQLRPNRGMRRGTDAMHFVSLVCLVRFLSRFAYGAYLAHAWSTWFEMERRTSSAGSGFWTDASTLVFVTFVCQAFFEVPSGVVADRIGRARTVLFGLTAVMCCFILYSVAAQSLIPRPTLLLSGEIVLAIGLSLMSGAFEAWAIDGALRYSSVNDTDRIEDITVARLGKYGHLGSLVGGPIALAVGGQAYPVAATAAGCATLLVWVLSFRELNDLTLEPRSDSGAPHHISRAPSLAVSFLQTIIIYCNPSLILREAWVAVRLLATSVSIIALWVLLLPSETIGQTSEYLWREVLERAPGVGGGGSHVPSQSHLMLAFLAVQLGGVAGNLFAEWGAARRFKRTRLLLFPAACMLVASIMYFGTGKSAPVNKLWLLTFVPGLLKFGAEAVFAVVMGRLQSEITRRGLSDRRATITSALVIIVAGFVGLVSLVDRIDGNPWSQVASVTILGTAGTLVAVLVIATFLSRSFDEGVEVIKSADDK